MYSKFKANNTLSVTTDASFTLKYRDKYYSVTFVSEGKPCNTKLDTVSFWVDYYEFAELNSSGEVVRVLDSSDHALISILERNLSVNLNNMKCFVDNARQISRHESDQQYMIDV